MKKKVQLIALSILLVAVIAGGVWLVSGGPGRRDAELPDTPDIPDIPDIPDAPVEDPGTPNGETEGAFNLAGLKPMHFSLRQKEEELPVSPQGIVNIDTIFSYEDQFCLLTYRLGEADGDFAVDVVSILSGETLHSFPAEDFPVSYNFPDTYGLVELGDNFAALAIDENGTLWAFYLFWEDSFEILIAPCKPGATEDDIVALCDLGDSSWPSPTKFLVRDGYAFLKSGLQLIIADLSDGTHFEPTEGDRVTDFCPDDAGNIYYLRGNSGDIEKYSLKDKKVLWTKRTSELPFLTGIDVISYVSPGGLFVSGANGPSDPGGIYWMDPETGENYHELASFSLDVDGLPESFCTYQFAVDSQYRIYAAVYYYDFSTEDEEDYESVRSVYLLEPEIVDIAPEELVTLTITAPYEVDSVANAVRVYQRTHPEVAVVWDTQYISREEYQKNILEYRDQIAVRTMTGDVGDLQMISGAGLDQKIITDTDAYLDLSEYLKNCPFQEELGWNIIEALRGGDGAIRAVPLAASPSYYIWNMQLLEELGNPVDPNTVTWSELLDLALQWKEKGTRLSLMIEADRQSREDTMLYQLLLANLYDAEQADGSIQLDQPYLRELLEKWKELHGSMQLVGRDDYGDFIREDVLLSAPRSKRSGDAVNMLMYSENVVGELLAAPMPKGEVNKKQQGYAFCWGIPAFSKNQEAAWELLEYLISSEGLPNYSYTDDTLVANTAAQENLFAYQNGLLWSMNDETEVAKKYFDQLCALQDTPYNSLSEPYGWASAVYTPIKAYIAGELTLDEAMETANTNWERFVLE